MSIGFFLMYKLFNRAWMMGKVNSKNIAFEELLWKTRVKGIVRMQCIVLVKGNDSYFRCNPSTTPEYGKHSIAHLNEYWWRQTWIKLKWYAEEASRSLQKKTMEHRRVFIDHSSRKMLRYMWKNTHGIKTRMETVCSLFTEQKKKKINPGTGKKSKVTGH